MKFTSLLAIIAISASFHTVNANESESTENQELEYCKEQVESYGIVDAQEKDQMLQECLVSFKMPSGDEQAAQE